MVEIVELPKGIVMQMNYTMTLINLIIPSVPQTSDVFQLRIDATEMFFPLSEIVNNIRVKLEISFGLSLFCYCMLNVKSKIVNILCELLQKCAVILILTWHVL